MSYTIDYSGLSGPEKQAKALADCQNYLGERFDTVVDCVVQLLSQNQSKEAIEFALSFTGIQGYPARALIEHAQALRTLEG